MTDTELFVSDIHGEYRAFSHVLRSGCGRIRQAIDELFADSLPEAERAALATLVYYPEEKISFMSFAPDGRQWAEDQVPNLVVLLEHLAKDPAVLEDLPSDPETLCHLIQKAAVDRLHMVGDVYDRGPAPQLIMDELAAYHSVDVQWGNHDIVWMGAALGQLGCVAHVVRNCARYGNLSVLEDAYGMDLSSLRAFAAQAYSDDPCVGFALKGKPDLPADELELNVKIQKAMAIIQFKVEAKLIDENPSYGLEDRKLLHRINRADWTIDIDGVTYEIGDHVFPTVDWDDPYALTAGEEAVLADLQAAFLGCVKLQQHMDFFLEKGSLYKVCGKHLLYHACVPLNADGSLKEVTIYGQTLKGKALFDFVDANVRAAYTATDPAEKKRGLDLIWYLWLGQGSPLFAKSKMATFEIYLIADKAARKEVKNPYYTLLEDEEVLAGIFRDFGMDPATSRIVCGHVPVKVKDGEDPVKCGGKALIIDGGFSVAYQPTTGIAGMALLSDERGVTLASFEPLPCPDDVIGGNADIPTTFRVIEGAGE